MTADKPNDQSDSEPISSRKKQLHGDDNKDKDQSAKSGYKDSLISSPLPPEIAEKIPSNVREEITQFMFRATASSAHPLADKITEDHITTSLRMTNDDRQRQFEFAKSNRLFQMAIFIIVIAVFIFLVIFLADKPNILAPMLTAILGFAAGFGVGKKL